MAEIGISYRKIACYETRSRTRPANLLAGFPTLSASPYQLIGHEAIRARRNGRDAANVAVRYHAYVPLPLFVLPGIGGDERLFDAQRAVRDIRPISWILPMHRREPLTDYAARLASEIQIGEPFDLGGSSFGGMIALELARHLSPRHVFLFGSCRSHDGVAPLLRSLRSLAAISPDRLLHPPRMFQPLIARYFGATMPAHVDLFAEMLAATPSAFIRWASSAVFSWSGVSQLPMPICHVHGDRDRLIPVHRVRPDRIVVGAGHLLNLTHADAVNDFIAHVASD